MKKLVYLLLGLVVVFCMACGGGASSSTAKSTGKAHLIVAACPNIPSDLDRDEYDNYKIVLFDGDVDVDENTNVNNILDKSGLKYETKDYADMFYDHYVSDSVRNILKPEADGPAIYKIDKYEVYGNVNAKSNNGCWVWYYQNIDDNVNRIDKNGKKLYLAWSGGEEAKVLNGDTVYWEYTSYGDRYEGANYDLVSAEFWDANYDVVTHEISYKTDENGRRIPNKVHHYKINDLERKDPLFVASLVTEYGYLCNERVPLKLDEITYIENYGWTSLDTKSARMRYYVIYVNNVEYTPKSGLIDCMANDEVVVYSFLKPDLNIDSNYSTTEGFVASTMQKPVNNITNDSNDQIDKNVNTNDATIEINPKTFKEIFTDEKIKELDSELKNEYIDELRSNAELRIGDNELIYTFTFRDQMERAEGDELEGIKNELLDFAMNEAKGLVEFTGIKDAFVTIEYKNPDGSKVYTASSGAEETIYFGR